MLYTLAWKNIWRNKKRSTIILLAITFGLWGGLYSGALWMGMGESMVDTAINRDLAHLQIHEKGFLNNIRINQSIPNAETIIKQIAGEVETKAVSGRTLFEGMAASSTSSFGVRINGIVPEVEQKVSSISTKLVTGQYFGTGKRNEIVIGKKLAERLKLKLNNKIILSFQSLDGDIQYESCRVVGIFRSASSLFDQSNVFLTQTTLKKILGKDLIHEIVIRSKNAELMYPLYDRLKAQYTELEVKSWRDLAPELAYTAAVMESFTYMFVGIILFALLFGIINTMLMSVLERTHELGMLLAIGMSKFRVFMMILIETIYLSITGGILGFIIGALSISQSQNIGLDFSALSESLGSFGASTIIYPVMPTEMYLEFFVMIIFTALCAAIMPALKAIRLQPSEAIRTY